jgi:hypothetical protein
LNEAIKDGVASIEYVKENKKELMKLLRKIWNIFQNLTTDI